MLTFTKEGREAVIEALHMTKGLGNTSCRFEQLLHKSLSVLNLREDHISLVRGKCKVTFKEDPENPMKTVHIDCEFSLRWYTKEGEPYMFGGLVWHNASQEFSVHT